MCVQCPVSSPKLTDCIAYNSRAGVFLLMLLWQLALIFCEIWHGGCKASAPWAGRTVGGCSYLPWFCMLTAAVQWWQLHCPNPRDTAEFKRGEHLRVISFFINSIIWGKEKHWYKIPFQIRQSLTCCVSNMSERKGMLRNLHFKGHSATAPGFWKSQFEPASWLVWRFGLFCWLYYTFSVKDVSQVEFQHMLK